MPKIELDKTLQSIVDNVSHLMGSRLYENMITKAVNEAYQHGYATGRASVGEPKLADNQCPGGGKDPVAETIRRGITGHPGRGCCTVCGTDLKLTWKGTVRRHRRKR